LALHKGIAAYPAETEKEDPLRQQGGLFQIPIDNRVSRAIRERENG
jgi:hypothetical protein